ncbi:MAG: FlgD immunoglobulin-like domain containing protein [Candidatus Cloacimonadales bacterium]
MERKLKIFLFFVLIGTLLISCIFDSDSGNRFSVNLTVKDQEGNLLDDVEVNFANKTMLDNIPFRKGRPSVNINFSLENSVKTLIEIRDIENSFVKTLNDTVLSTGTYTVRWNGRNFNEEIMEDGLYYYIMETYDDDGDVVYFDKKQMYLLSIYNSHTTLYNGKASFHDKKPFMNLYSLGEIALTSEYGETYNVVNFSDTTYVLIERDGFHCIGSFVAQNKENKLNFTWNSEERKQINFRENQKVASDDLIPIETQLGNCYPNPFN